MRRVLDSPSLAGDSNNNTGRSPGRRRTPRKVLDSLSLASEGRSPRSPCRSPQSRSFLGTRGIKTLKTPSLDHLTLEDRLPRDSEVSSKASSQDDSATKSTTGSVLQFDPTQTGNVYKVKQVTTEESEFSHSQDGQNMDVSHFLSGAHSFQQLSPTKQPMFDFFRS